MEDLDKLLSDLSDLNNITAITTTGIGVEGEPKKQQQHQPPPAFPTADPTSAAAAAAPDASSSAAASTATRQTTKEALTSATSDLDKLMADLTAYGDDKGKSENNTEKQEISTTTAAAAAAAATSTNPSLSSATLAAAAATTAKTAPSVVDTAAAAVSTEEGSGGCGSGLGVRDGGGTNEPPPHHHQPMPQAPGVCCVCRKEITGQLLAALGMEWHVECFACTHCSVILKTDTFYEHDGLPYCENDFYELFGERCDYCKRPVRGDCISALGKKWCSDHFFCAQCGCKFGSDGFMERDGRPYCKKDYYDLFAQRCARCVLPIMAESISALSKNWHPSCFTCKACSCAFPDGQFYEVDGQPFCKTHFHTVQGTLCYACRIPVTGRTIVALDNKWHPECFKCTYCSNILHEGSFLIDKGKPYCQPCHVRLFLK